MGSTGLRALAVRGPYLGASGHDHHVREFVRHLACPLGVDGERFRPDAQRIDLGAAGGRPVRDYPVRVLNVSEPVPRKNLLALLRVWITATSPRDDAILVLKLGRAPNGGAVRLTRDLAALEQRLGQALEAARGAGVP